MTRFLTSRVTLLVLAVLAIALVCAFQGLHPAWMAVPVLFGISFNGIPSVIREPFVTIEFDNTKATQGPGLLSYRVLILGQKTTGGSWAANSIQRATSVEQVITGGGRGSMLHRQALAYFANNRFTETFVGVLGDDGAGVAASGTLTVTGPATQSGTLHLYLGGTYVPVLVTSGDAQNSIAAAINAAINAALDLPVSSTVSTNVVTVTFRHKGLVGNSFDMRLNYQDGEATPAGVAVAVAALASGTTNPALATLIAALGDNWYQVVIHPYTDATSLTAIETEMASRFGPLRMIDGIAITSAAGTQSALGSIGDARNSPHSVIVAQPGKNPLTPPMEFAAAVGAQTAFHGNIDPARPFKTIALSWVKPPIEADRFTFNERNLLLGDGISTTSAPAGGIVQISQLVTTYQTAPSGAADESYRLVNTLLTALYVRYVFRTGIANQFSRHKLADDGIKVGPGQSIVTPQTAKAYCLTVFRQLEAMGLVQNFDQFKQDLVVTRPVDRNRLDFLLPPTFVNQFIVGAGKVEFRL
jgi:phage tail sheath gpL-like